MTLATSQRHQDTYRAFYTSNQPLVQYMIQLLEPQAGDCCLEPSAGHGFFIDGLLTAQKNLQIQAIDLAPEAIRVLQEKYVLNHQIEILQQDFLLSGDQQQHRFNRIIANPPYGAWQDYQKRNLLKTIFPDLYVKESYGLFIAKSLSYLKPDGRAVFIIPETFLYLHLQQGLRQRILEHYSIVSIDIFPSKVFPNVDFGYAKMCIIVIENKKPNKQQTFLIQQCAHAAQLFSRSGSQFYIQQNAVLSRPAMTFPLQGHSAQTHLIDTASIQLGDIANCVTGLYTGADGKFLKRATGNTRGMKKYVLIDPQKISVSTKPDLYGFSTEQCFLPILKGGGSAYLKPVSWFIDWSELAVQHYQSDSKARFQNSQFYFSQGIGFPMVSSARATASIIEPTWLFDQSVVGVFPKKPEYFGFLLAFLNSSICWQLLRQINPSANNSARYLKRLPIILPTTKQLLWFDQTISSYVAQLKQNFTRDVALEMLLDQKILQLYPSLIENKT